MIKFVNPHLTSSRTCVPPWGCLWVPACSRCVLCFFRVIHRLSTGN
nr:MAG TPA: hypothetical protein [Caudoviricetes sp.]